ncbi:MAG TPA: hypothetical protein VFB38_13970 [Chthonomonadaceae bacterium]|nr:hypothetical protein [Chthonomonadaceae bacterium]
MHRTLFAFALLCLLLLSASSGYGATVATEDGLVLAFRDSDAAITEVGVDGRPVKLNGSPGGFYVVDMVAEKRLGQMDYRSAAYPGTRLQATARPSPTGVVIQGKANDLWVRARVESRGDYLAVTGDLVNLRPQEDRAVILYFRLPVEGSGARWGRNLGVEEPIQPGQRYLNATEFHQAYRPAMSRLPIATLSGAGWGLSLAQPMDVPRFFRIAYQEPYGLQMEYEFGLSAITWKFRNRAPFRFLLYRHDPAWGLRSAFERYYRFFPELFRKIVRDGMWIDDWEGKRAQLGDPTDYGIVFNETGNWADEEQRSQDVLSMMYIEPWCDHIEGTPDQIPAMAKDTPENRQEARFGRGADLRTNALQLLNSAVYGPDGKILDPRTAAVGGFYVEGTPDNPYYRYLTNPDPELPTPFGGYNRAQKIIRYDLYTSWGRQTDQPQYEKDGIYYDSIGAAWAGSHLQNFRRDHMPYVDFPLTFDHKTGRVTITHGFSAIEFLRWCTTQAHNDGRPTMGNASPGYFLPFVAPYLDMGGANENYEYEADFAGLKEERALMYQKPLSYLNNRELADPARAEAVLDRLLLYACYPGADSVQQMVAQRALYRAYIPLYNALGAAGWEPVPYARVSPPDAWCERFGNAKRGYFFALRNPGKARELTLTLDRKALGIERAAFQAVAGCQIQSAGADSVRLAVPAQWTAIIAVNRPDAGALAALHRRERIRFRALTKLGRQALPSPRPSPCKAEGERVLFGTLKLSP